LAIEIFNRYENKYLLPEKTFTQMQNRLNDYMEPDAHNRSQATYSITNLYYDTPDNQLIRASLARPKYKEKLRLRAYGVPEGDAKVYVEIKKKFNGLVNKRRSALTLPEAYAFLQQGLVPEFKPYMNRQVLNEAAYILERQPLRPALYLSYERRAYFGIGQHDLRVSFDTNIRTRRADLALEAGDHGERLLEEDWWVMEVKVARSIPVWLCHLLAEYKIYPQSFSKYGAAYTQSLKRRPEQKIITFPPGAFTSLAPEGALQTAFA
jgi:SPX domain protein involved in polyphosphate accumulation